MKTTRVAGTPLLLLLSLAASPEDGLAEEARPELHVYLMDCIGLSDGLLDGVRDEVDAIYAPTHVRIVWQEERPPDPTKRYQARVYLLDELPPSLKTLMTISKGSAPMALTLGIRPTEPAADIYISRKAVLGRASQSHGLPLQHMARALGRTLAHELAHRFLRSRHTERGILRSIFRERDLIDGNRSGLFFSPEQIAVLQATALLQGA
jgi:hypothetical protein